MSEVHKDGPIIIIEDDKDDQEILAEIFKKLDLDNEIIYFADGNLALEYLNQTEVHPFLIMSDVNMPKINGFDLRNLVQTNERLHIKCIPYLFFTTSATKKSVSDAYTLSVQGFFEKPSSFSELEKTIKIIIDYWKACVAPGQYE
ncbi:MAG: response regulator [Taibaiella sp.]|nr:response regulator [Taibaiella sp.]